jgi:hypothetical protein
MFVGVRPQHAGDMRSGLRAIGQREEREESLGDEWKLHDPAAVGDLEAL